MGCVSHSMTKQINGPHTVHVATYKSCALTASGFATISGFSAENVRDFHMASRQLLAPSVTSGGRSASAVAAGGAFGAPAEAIVVSRLLVTSLLHSRTQRAREAFTGKCNLRYGDRCGYAAAEWCGGSASKLCVCACVALVGLAQSGSSHHHKSSHRKVATRFAERANFREQIDVYICSPQNVSC